MDTRFWIDMENAKSVNQKLSSAYSISDVLDVAAQLEKYGIINLEKRKAIVNLEEE